LSGKYKSVATDHAAKRPAVSPRRIVGGMTTASVAIALPLGDVFNRVSPHYGVFMNITLSLGPLVSLIAGILILVMPRLLNYIVALYLIIIGIIGIFGVGSSHF
jgi:hypothetical protein